MSRFNSSEPIYKRYQIFTSFKLFNGFLFAVILPIIIALGLFFWANLLPIWAFYFPLIAIFGGTYFGYLVFYGMHSYDFVDSQLYLNGQLPDSKSLIFELVIPNNLNYDVKVMYDFFAEFHGSFTSFTQTTANFYKFGKKTPKLKFNFIANQGVIKSYTTVPIKKITETKRLFETYFPEIKLVLTTNPFITMPYSWNNQSSYEKYDDLVGGLLASRFSPFYPMTFEDDSNVNKGKFNLFLNHLRTRLPNQKVIVQLVISGKNTGSADELKRLKSQREVKNSAITQFTTKPKNLKKNIDFSSKKANNSEFRGEDLAGLKIFTPDIIKKYNERINQVDIFRLGIAYKVLIFCKKEDRKFTEDMLELAVRTYYGSNELLTNFLEIKYPACTFQKFYRWQEQNDDMNFLFSFIVFPLRWLQTYVYKLYDSVYFPKENQFRKSQIYTNVVSQSGFFGWGTSSFLPDHIDAGNLFQFPTKIDIDFDDAE